MSLAGLSENSRNIEKINLVRSLNFIYKYRVEFYSDSNGTLYIFLN